MSAGLSRAFAAALFTNTIRIGWLLAEVGASLARIELQVVLGALTKRFPTLRLAVPPDRLRLRTEVSTCGVAELPVTW